MASFDLTPRRAHIRARYRTVAGRVVERELADFVARIFQHKDDHLRGIVILDWFESARDVAIEKGCRKQITRPTPADEPRNPRNPIRASRRTG